MGGIGYTLDFFDRPVMFISSAEREAIHIIRRESDAETDICPVLTGKIRHLPHHKHLRMAEKWNYTI